MSQVILRVLGNQQCAELSYITDVPAWLCNTIRVNNVEYNTHPLSAVAKVFEGNSYELHELLWCAPFQLEPAPIQPTVKWEGGIYIARDIQDNMGGGDSVNAAILNLKSYYAIKYRTESEYKERMKKVHDEV